MIPSINVDSQVTQMESAEFTQEKFTVTRFELYMTNE